jgi:hypothetical protein
MKVVGMKLDPTGLLATLKARGVHLEVVGGRLRWRPREAVTAEEREILVQHKAEMLVLLRPPWDQAEADALVARVQERRGRLYGPAMSPPDRDGRRRLSGLADAIDRAWAARDMAQLRKAVAAYLDALGGVAVRRAGARDASAPAPATASYSPELAELVAWFRQARAGCRLPVETFHLAPWSRVTHPARFYAALEADLADGPSAARARLGGLADDLGRLRQATE